MRSFLAASPPSSANLPHSSPLTLLPVAVIIFCTMSASAPNAALSFVPPRRSITFTMLMIFSKFFFPSSLPYSDSFANFMSASSGIVTLARASSPPTSASDWRIRLRLSMVDWPYACCARANFTASADAPIARICSVSLSACFAASSGSDSMPNIALPVPVIALPRVAIFSPTPRSDSIRARRASARCSRSAS